MSMSASKNPVTRTLYAQTLMVPLGAPVRMVTVETVKIVQVTVKLRR